jgi:hypothetical protein
MRAIIINDEYTMFTSIDKHHSMSFLCRLRFSFVENDTINVSFDVDLMTHTHTHTHTRETSDYRWRLSLFVAVVVVVVFYVLYIEWRPRKCSHSYRYLQEQGKKKVDGSKFFIFFSRLCQQLKMTQAIKCVIVGDGTVGK